MNIVGHKSARIHRRYNYNRVELEDLRRVVARLATYQAYILEHLSLEPLASQLYVLVFPVRARSSVG